MTTSLTPLTELEAINDMLSLISETPLASLDEVDSVADAQIARQILNRESRAIQNEGYSFNTEENYRLVPDVSGNIVLPTNTLEVDPVDETLDYIIRDGKLWDRTNQTFTITDPVYVNIKFLYSFDELPASARQYISLLAGRKFENRMIGDGQAHQINENDVTRAKAVFLEQEADTTEANVITGVRSIRRTLRNRDWY